MGSTRAMSTKNDLEWIQQGMLWNSSFLFNNQVMSPGAITTLILLETLPLHFTSIWSYSKQETNCMSSFCSQHLCKVGMSPWPFESIHKAPRTTANCSQILQIICKNSQTQPIIGTWSSSVVADLAAEQQHMKVSCHYCCVVSLWPLSSVARAGAKHLVLRRASPQCAPPGLGPTGMGKDP